MKPLILDFKLPRYEEENPVTYTYDHAEALNVIWANGVKKPFIDIDASDVELLTKTKVERERDDDQFLSKLGTKTEAGREKNDSHDIILEMMTKTLTVRERDDRDNQMLEMMTKTRTQRERDDEYFDHYQQN
ncbi:hypothetical protein HDF19_19705 [Mucilaginibacter sp. E4BP6]|jgi:hypothetical protein|uniref:hypothetical protein n=1 Tax=Mucilaginibacter sp. E4BP6 TaxID=2723089 RepID=UPI001798BFD2|nr:hypothetical protein [Mucilaginibacter sp. E4BP6]NYE67216.1 hypothetical protein [Mucilaginibacter sp. E4BP6]